MEATFKGSQDSYRVVEPMMMMMMMEFESHTTKKYTKLLTLNKQ
jgi:hypothetical protein